MKKLVAITVLCALLLTAMLMPAGAALSQGTCPDGVSAITLLLQLLSGLNKGDCTVTLPTLPARPEVTEPACGESGCESGCESDSGCTGDSCLTDCGTPAGTCPTAPSQPEPDEPAVTQPAQPESKLSAYEQEVVRLVNEIRAQYGLAALTVNTALSEVAREKSADMSRNNYFDHDSPTYGSPFDMMRAFGISYRTAAENIAVGYSTPAAAVQGWMDSPTHRAAMLSSSYTQTGVGYVQSGNYWTQMFIS